MPAFDRREFLTGGLALALAACSRSPAEARPRQAGGKAQALIAAARAQIGVTLAYDSGYSAIAYPGGDIVRERGVCTDVVIRAYRDALSLDLQREVHEDMARAFAAYPKRWGLARPDRNIDHRRVPNLERFWDRAGARLPLPADPSGWQPGEVFTSLVAGNLPHTGIVSDRVSANGSPMVIHNIGAGTQEEDISVAQRLVGRFRWQV
jgi:uncharacterized protein YijF (DUF1287 family)